ncbi:hypothetical protein GQ457_10G028910 [Hibiscus cannabinus]
MLIGLGSSSPSSAQARLGSSPSSENRDNKNRTSSPSQSNSAPQSNVSSQGYNYTPMQAVSHMFLGSAPNMHHVMPYAHAASSSFVPTMMPYGAEFSHGVVRQSASSFPASAPSFSAFLGQAHVPPTFSSLPASFMTRAGASYVDGVIPTSGQEVVWYPDSGATHHITNNRENLQSDAVYTGKHSLLMGNGDKIAITHVGSGCLPNGDRTLYLHNLLCVPDITKNLLSVSQFARDNDVFFEFYSHKYVVKDVQTQVPLLEGRLTPEGLYELRGSSAESLAKSTVLNPVFDNYVSAKAYSAANVGSFPLVIMNDGMQKMTKSDNGSRSTVPTLVPDRSIAKSGTNSLGPALPMGDNESSPTGQPNNGASESDENGLPQGSVGYPNPYEGCGVDCFSGKRGENFILEDNSSQEGFFAEPQSDLGISSSSFRLGDFDALQGSATSREELDARNLPLVVNAHPMVTRGKDGIRKPKALSANLLLENEEPKNIREAMRCAIVKAWIAQVSKGQVQICRVEK